MYITSKGAAAAPRRDAGLELHNLHTVGRISRKSGSRPASDPELHDLHTVWGQTRCAELHDLHTV